MLGDKFGCPVPEICLMLRLSLLHAMSIVIASYSGTHIRMACCRIEAVRTGSWVAARREGRWDIEAATGRVDVYG